MNIENVINKLQSIVAENGFELMSRYPNDLLVHDRAILERTAAPGAKFAWCVGHSHTHMFPLGIHPKENESVTYVTNLSSSDRFYVIELGKDDFRIKEVARDAFEALQRTPIPYDLSGVKEAFWLVKNKSRVGYIAAERVGTYAEFKVKVTITPVRGISKLDEGALKIWGSYAATGLAGSLFVRTELVEAEPVSLAVAA